MMFKSRDSLVDFVRTQMANNDNFAINAMIEIYKHQTQMESARECTVESNKVGFNHSDAKALTKFAKEAIDGTVFNSADMIIIHRRMPKYSRQLVKHYITEGLIRKSGRSNYIFDNV